MKKRDDDYRDVEVSCIIWLVDAMRELCQKHHDIIRQYYAEYINGTHLRAVEPLHEAVAKSPQVTACLQRCISLMKEADPTAQVLDLSQLRKNWLQAQVLVSETAKGFGGAVQREGDLRSLVRRMSVVVMHSRFVDEQTELFVEFASLKNLWWHQRTVDRDFDVTLAKRYCETPAAKHCMSFVRSCNTAVENTTSVCDAERSEIGEASVKRARGRLMLVTECIINAIIYIASRQQKLNGTTSMIRASFNDPNGKNYPGKESDPKNAAMVNSTKKAATHLSMMCRAMVSYDRIVVYNTEFIPMLFLRDELRKKFAEYMRKLAAEAFHQPEEIPDRVERMVNVMNLACQFLGLKISSLVREVLQEQVQMNDVKLHTLETAVVLAQQEKRAGSTMIQVLALKMRQFLWDVCKHAETAAPHDEDNQPVTYSDVYRGFVQWGVDRRSEQQHVHVRYTVERLSPLCGLLGSAGVRFLQRQLVFEIEKSVGNIFKLMLRQRAPIEEFRTALKNADDLVEIVFKIQALDIIELLKNSVHTGVFLTMRDMFGKGLGLAAEAMPALNAFFESTLNACEGRGIEVLTHR